MKKLRKVGLLSIGLMSTMGAFLSTPILADPPPPPPVDTVVQLGKLTKAAQSVEDNYNKFISALDAYVKDKTANNEQILKTAASALGDSMSPLKLMLGSIEKKLNSDISADLPSEKKAVKNVFGNKPTKAEKNLMHELNKRLEGKKKH